MRKSILFFCLIFLFLGFKDFGYANKKKHSFNTHFAQNSHIKLAQGNNPLLLIEYTDIDLEEENVNNNDVKESNHAKNFLQKCSLLPIRKLIYSSSLFYKQNIQNFLLLRSNSCPIYLSQRVLRI